MIYLLDLRPDQLAEQLAALNQPPYRAKQIAAWVYQRGVCDFADMTDLPDDLRKDLAERFQLLRGKVVARRDARDGVTKLLIEWADGQRVETVLIPTERRATACLSTQVGCPIGCTFCASGASGFQRNLSAGEIVEQALHLRQATGREITHVVFMGMGEPLANYDATLAATRALADPARFGLSARRLTISTVGVPSAIRRLAREGLPLTLAVSLHAPNDAVRRQIVPAASHVPIERIVEAAGEYFRLTGREVTLEYVLLGGVNDTNVCAEGLARLAARIRCSVNLILYNPVAGSPYRRPSAGAAKVFAERLRRRGVNAHLRRSRGLEAEAACGQLRRSAAGSTP